MTTYLTFSRFGDYLYHMFKIRRLLIWHFQSLVTTYITCLMFGDYLYYLFNVWWLPLLLVQSLVTTYITCSRLGDYLFDIFKVWWLLISHVQSLVTTYITCLRIGDYLYYMLNVRRLLLGGLLLVVYCHFQWFDSKRLTTRLKGEGKPRQLNKTDCWNLWPWVSGNLNISGKNQDININLYLKCHSTTRVVWYMLS